MQLTTYPGSFGGDPYTFGWALFSLIALASFSLATMLSIARDAWVHGLHFHKPLGLAQAISFGWLATIFLGVIGDVAILIAWGEVSELTMNKIMRADRICDAVALIPFAISFGLLVRGRTIIAFQLMRMPIPADLWPTLPMIRHDFRIIFVILFIAWGVTVGK